MKHTIDEFQCTQCRVLSKDIPVKKLYLPTEKQPDYVVEFDCPNCKCPYQSTTYIKDVKIEGMEKAEFPSKVITISPHESSGH